MSHAKNRRGLLALAIAASFVAGCGTQQLGAPTGPGTASYQTLDAKSDQKAGKKHHKWLKFLKGLDLTEEQKQSLETIKSEFEPGVDHDDFRAWMSRLKTLLTAETVDQEALGKLADEVHAEMNTFKSKYLDMLVDVRNVLTEEQRQQVADKLKEKAAKKPEKDKKRDKKMLEGLGLTEAQKAALKHEKTSRADKYNAMATFFMDGDRAALDTALTPDDLDAKVDRMVETLAGLSLETRQKLVERMEKAHEKMADRKREKAADDDKTADADDDDDEDDDDEEDDEEDDDDEA